MLTAEKLSQLSTLSSFDFQSHTRMVYGVGSVDKIGGLARELGARNILLVTDAGLVEAGHAPRVVERLKSEGFSVVLFTDVIQNPTTDCVEQCAAVARSHQIDTLIGLGGGSAMDTAKGCNFLVSNGGRMQDYWGYGKASKPMLPLIAIPTTAGTGSECQSYALIADAATHQKMACGDSKALPKVALLDPELTLSQPFRVTACTGIDAIAHALESAVTLKRTPLSGLFSREAFRLTIGNFRRVLREPGNLEARGKMLLGASFAGTAIENSMLGAAHSAANPLTAHFEIAHGQGVGMMLPDVIEFNATDPVIAGIYLEYSALAATGEDPEEGDSVADLVDRLKGLMAEAKFPKRLREAGVEADQIPLLAKEAAAQWTAKFNPRTITEEDFRDLYNAAF